MAGRLEDVRVLIVDDDRDVLDTFDAAFQAEGALTRLVEDGHEAVLVCQEDPPPDIVVLDMMLPRRSGFLVLEKIKGHEDSPLVIMVTANEGKRHQAYAESLGVDRYLLKPVPLDRLIDAAEALLDQRDAEDDAEDEDDLEAAAPPESGDSDDEDDAPEPAPKRAPAKAKPKAEPKAELRPDPEPARKKKPG